MSTYSVPVTEAEEAMAWRMLSALGSDTPTPQFSRTPDGVEIQWLVNGTSVEVWTDGEETDLAAYGSDATPLWRYELAATWTADDTPLRIARELLSVMAQGVEYPAPEGRLVTT